MRLDARPRSLAPLGRDDHVRGSIAPGLAADFAVLDRDPFTQGAESLLEARVVRTIVGGATVYEV